ncbi:hypothetical protein ASD15_10670 [Massilia sp. Root351]|jgi:hypothetical protein|uniref:hypothetical protein n=1 Tax=Massilia sp. Root351 TaxID=1736522 RepID=UPI00070FF01D|nr:hypothetical protein [Massilia sp. Root351]KQV82475.1 hypothetical protein ASD15_10670 [Massilia sp. Root351]
MNRFSLLLLAAVGAPLLVHAQVARPPAAVTDANAAVPALQYRSIFTSQPTPDPATTPDKVWIQANRDVTGGSGHGGHGGHAGHGTEPARQPAADPHQGHQDPHQGHKEQKDHDGHQHQRKNKVHEGHDMHKKGH